ncbi:MAG TPA: protein kinase [Polyangia bacterium]|jgi:serine/threonine-protein kinase
MADSRYRITERVASGGMAEVFRGVAESLQGFRKNIAIKRVLPALTQNKKFVAMFLDEARLSLGLQHANIVQVFDIGHSEDTYFIVMEYVDGVDLKALLEWRRRMGKRLPMAVSLNIVNEICKGLSYAHELLNAETGRPLGIVHRDVSPPNVLISKQGEVKVVDFGLAKASSQIETTDPGVVKGKMSYLSPEAARGEEVDSRSDIFSVGILLYELLTGKRLFYGETDYQTVELVRNARIPPIKAQNPEVEQELEDIVRKTLAKNREDRFQSANDLQDALAHYSYSRGLKVISRDVADLVRQCLEDKSAQSSGGKRRAGNILDNLLQDEINKFTSVDFEDPGARPLLADELGGGGSDLIDPRAWAGEAGSGPSAPFSRPTGALSFDAAGGRATLKETPAVGSRAQAPARPAQSLARPVHSPAKPAPSRQRPAPVAASNDLLLRPTPGPDALASVLEPEPNAADAVAPVPARSPRAVLIAVVVGAVVAIVAIVGLLASRR